MKTFFKWAMIVLGFLLLGLIALVFWMRAGEEEPLVYGTLAFELGPQDLRINGYTFLRQYCERHHAEFLREVESAFHRPVFLADQEFSPAIPLYAGELRSGH